MPQKSCEPKSIRSRATFGCKNGIEQLDEGSSNSHNCGMIQKPTSVGSLDHVMLSVISRLRPKKYDSDCSREGPCYLQFTASKIFRASNSLIIQGDRIHKHSPSLVLSVHGEKGRNRQC